MPRFASNLSMMFNELDFLDRFRAASQAGFTGVEYLSPYEYEAGQILDRLQNYGLTQVLFNLPSGDWEAGERGIACHPNRIAEFRAGVDIAMDYANTLNCNQINCLAGIRPEGIDPNELRQTFVENLRYASGRFHEAGILLLIEAINIIDIPGFFLTGTNQGKGIIEEVSSPNLAFQYDVYHMQIMEGNLAQTIELNLDLVRHIQIADNPGRNEPGTGEINYPFIFALLDRIGYQGWVGAEYKPSAETVEGLSWLNPYIS